MKNQILNSIKEYISSQKKTFIPGMDVIQYSGPVLDANEYIAITNTVLDGWFGLGGKAKLFEEQTAKRLGKNYGVYVNSGSSANLLALETMKELYYKDTAKNKIITVAASFPTTVNPILQLGFEPIFVDVEIGTYNPNHAQMMEALGRDDVVGVMYAHPLGIPVAHTKLYYEHIKKKGGFLIEDCCDALDSTYYGEPVGTYSDAATLSFYAAHHITTGEGGMVAFATKKEENICRSFRDWGRGCFCSGKDVLSDVGACNKRFDDWLCNGSITDHRYVYERQGYNLKPLELQAAMGLEQIKKLDDFTRARKENFATLDNFMRKYEDYFILPIRPQDTDPSWFSYPITIRDNAPFMRHEIVSFLENNKIQTRNFFAGNLMDHKPYRHHQLSNEFETPNSSKITNNTFMLGVWPGLNSDMYAYIFNIFDSFMGKFGK